MNIGDKVQSNLIKGHATIYDKQVYNGNIMYLIKLSNGDTAWVYESQIKPIVPENTTESTQKGGTSLP